MKSPRKIDRGYASQRAADASSWPASGFADDRGFGAVFDSSGEALLVVDPTGRILKANSRGREFLRLGEQPSSGKAYLRDCVLQLPGEPLAEIWSPPLSLPHILNASLSTGFPIRITLRSILPGSRLLLCLEEGSLVQRAEAKWRQVEAELHAVLESVHTGIILFDPGGHVRFSNIRFAQFFGLDVRMLEKLETFADLDELVAGRFRSVADFSGPWRSFTEGKGEPGHDELEIARPSPRVLERFFRPVLDSEGRSIGWLELYTDVTGERQVQAKMLQTEKAAALGQLVSGIAHELNNPLTAIMGYAQLLLGHGLLPAQLSEAGMVYQEAERARHIVKNLLFFARENQPERSRVDLNEIVERTVALRSYELRVENIAVECQLATPLPITMADPHQLQQVVLNLIVNAEQALLEERGQGRIQIRTYRGVHRPGEWICLEISDDGPGIPSEIVSRIFDPFFTTKPPGVGTGLGLSIVYGIIQQHNGEISVDSQRGTGTTFLIELPVVASTALPNAADDRPSALAIAQDSVSREVVRGRILVVEDEPTVARLIVDVLGEEGHQAEFVLDSREGLTLLSRSCYDLVICDLRMPRLDGFAFYDALVRSGSPAQNGVIFITGDLLAARTREFLHEKGLPYLAKPFLVEELKLAVSRALAVLRKDPEVQASAAAASHDAKSVS